MVFVREWHIYFNVDPVWIRLLFALTAFAYGITVLMYIVMWIVVPGSTDLEEPEVGKKMFRDPEHKVIGGVSGGIAAFFGIDLVAVRLLFIVFTVFFGVGFLVYIVLWIALPEATSLTDRMEMQGEPVTLSNIESNIKKNLNVDPNKEESTATKILLLPFRYNRNSNYGTRKDIGTYSRNPTCCYRYCCNSVWVVSDVYSRRPSRCVHRTFFQHCIFLAMASLQRDKHAIGRFCK